MDWSSSAFTCIAAFLLLSPALCAADDRIVSGKPLSPGAAVISDGGDFALGFFAPSNSTPAKLHLGIWYNNIPRRTVVWVANRATPIIVNGSSNSSLPSLAMTNTSDLVLSDASGQIVWTTNLTAVASSSSLSPSPSTAVLMNTGNLVVRSQNGTVLWQSFSQPTDTLLPGMKVRLSYRTLAGDRLVSWKSPEDPSPGSFSYGGDSDTFVQFFIWNGSRPAWRAGVWTGYMVTSSQFQANARTAVYLALVDTDNDLSIVFTVADGAPPTHFLLSDSGKLQLLGWNKEASEWMMLATWPAMDCFTYEHCGPGGSCDATGAVPTCKCLDGFEPVSAEEWNSGLFSRGCRRKEALRCGGDGHFVALPGMKVPDRFVHVGNRSLDECAAECGGDCNCVAYAYATLNSSAKSRGDVTRCLVWAGDGELVDTGRLGPGQVWGTVGAGGDSRKRKQRNAVKIAVPVLVIVTCISLSWFCIFRGKKRSVKEHKKSQVQGVLTATALELEEASTTHDHEFPFVKFDDIVAATNNFSKSFMVGQGGFGKVYKGMLQGCQEVAVKRLSRDSDQGIVEFRNEVTLIAKLQHRNLVRLLGCCVEGHEKLLIYEYLPNKSLDVAIFKSERGVTLDWPARFRIIKGVARGLVYLHHDSRLTIIHRDLKTSNALLDSEMRPKIADFGMARIFGDNQQNANTRRVVGTYGYMAPEYAMEGMFSVKTDIYSFGVLLLEVISGVKISNIDRIMDFPNLIVYAWSLWMEGRAKELVDLNITESCTLDEALLCIHVGLLCVQENPDDRPLMSSVVSILENGSTTLPTPNHPAYFAPRKNGADQRRDNVFNSGNEMTLTVLEGR
ncbi:Os09g0550600 [Oryza sativa Japonica Group]|uniref:Receptor-like serine/threonine-protein kinase n=1 Tax=Oryza sativa subsp. japonica TaxID=39947 RepID=A0A0P0XQ04_ORYSJ|nr:hypothetical protein EE612_049353 [Oryza sativa]BAT09297.1 Os09g0550600 [Oryza sativa Japonica Group]